MLHDDPQKGVARDPNSVARFEAELDSNEHDLKLFRQEADELRKQMNFGRAQVGLGDSRFQADAASARVVREASRRRGAARRGRPGRPRRRSSMGSAFSHS